MIACLLPAVGTYFKTQYEVDSLKASSASHEELRIQVEHNLIGVGIREEQIKNLTEAVRLNSEANLALAAELKQMRQEWSAYRSHR